MPNPYEAIQLSSGVRNTNPVGSWSQIHPTTQKYLVDNFGVDPKGANWMQQPQNLRDAINRYPLAGVKQMVAQGRFKPKINPAATAASTNIASFVGNMGASSTGGMSGLPLTAMSGQQITPVKGGGTLDLNKGTFTRAGANPPTTVASSSSMGKQGVAMTDKQMFKAAFLAKCVEDGLNVDQIAERVKTALHVAKTKGMHKQSDTLGLGTMAASGANTGVEMLKLLSKGYGLAALGAVAAPTALGYYGLGPLIHHVSKPNLPTRDELLKEEMTREYERQADILKKNTELAQRRKERAKNISGITRY